MAEKLKRICCANCIYLNMHKREISENEYNYRYGCCIAESGYLPFWLCYNRNDIELTTGGCGSYKSSLEFGTMFRFFTDMSKQSKQVCQYCGKVNGKRLIWNQTYHVYKLVKSEWFLRHRKQIQVLPEKTMVHGCMITTKEEKQRSHRNMAKARKERYIKEYGCDRN